MDQLSKRVVLVTGSTGGLGTAICKKLYDNDCRVVANHRNGKKAKEWQEQLKSEGYEVDIFEGDVADFDSVKNMIQNIEAAIGTIDVLVNNAGITKDCRFSKMSKEDWENVLSTNLTGVFNCTRHVINGMMDRQFGRIINISSVNAQRGQFGQTNYSAAKAGMHGFTKTLAMEVAKHGITVNTISPGYLGTDMVMAVPEKIREQIVAQIPVGRLGSTDEVAAVVSFLASESTSFITGANISINGGQHVY
jgi:acetoacetyl-CoA reductase